MIGKTLAHYTILSHIGTGGMGEVYRAQDTKLDREVALKALPEEFSNDFERVARFGREATTLAKLQHPNVATIYGFDKDQGRTFLVMELVEGEDLAERLRRGPIPTDEAIGMAAQIAEGLEAAHALGIVHRDLKPANIKVTPTGDVKLLDFGLARAFGEDDPEESSLDVTNSPTITAAMTMQGVILGTAAYMSPEQARGKTIDRQADIWSFGVVLFEMLTAHRLFGGETISDSIGAILHRNPDLSQLPDVPDQVVTLLRRCLARDKTERLRDIGDARLELADASAATKTETVATGSRRGMTTWAGAALIALLLGTVGWLALTRDQGLALSQVTLAAPKDQGIFLNHGSWNQLAISADGQTIAHLGGKDRLLHLRELGGLAGKPLASTEGAMIFDISPDGKWITFMRRDSKLWKVAVTGGAPIAVCDAQPGPGLSWGQGEIYFVGTNGGGLWSVSEDGGEPRQVSFLDDGREETSHRWPHVLPGGTHLLFTIKTAHIATFDDALIGLLDIESGEVTVLLTGGTQPKYSETGHIVYGRESKLFAVPFDLGTLAVKGTPSQVLDQVYTSDPNGSAQFALSAQGDLIYLPYEGPMAEYEVEWLDLTGQSSKLDITEPAYYDVDFSADGLKLAGRTAAANDKIQIWDFEREILTLLSTTPGNDAGPIWSPDATMIAYQNDRNGPHDIYLVAANGGSPARKLVTSDKRDIPHCWTPDGTRLLFDRTGSDGRSEIWIVFAVGDAEPVPILADENSYRRPKLSPDGRWLAYISDFSGSQNVYVRPFENPGNAVRVSVEGGSRPQWSPDGKTLYFVDGDLMMAAPVTTDGGLRIGSPENLFEIEETAFGPYALAPDGKRFLINNTVPGSEWHYGIHVDYGWAEKLKDIR